MRAERLYHFVHHAQKIGKRRARCMRCGGICAYGSPVAVAVVSAAFDNAQIAGDAFVHVASECTLRLADDVAEHAFVYEREAEFCRCKCKTVFAVEHVESVAAVAGDCSLENRVAPYVYCVYTVFHTIV